MKTSVQAGNAMRRGEEVRWLIELKKKGWWAFCRGFGRKAGTMEFGPDAKSPSKRKSRESLRASPFERMRLQKRSLRPRRRLMGREADGRPDSVAHQGSSSPGRSVVAADNQLLPSPSSASPRAATAPAFPFAECAELSSCCTARRGHTRAGQGRSGSASCRSAPRWPCRREESERGWPRRDGAMPASRADLGQSWD